MSTATLTSKGQITLPAPVRADLNLNPGDRVEFILSSEGRYEMVVAANDVRALRGRVQTSQPVSIDDMDNAIRMKASS